MLYSGHEYEGSEPWPVAAIEFRCESALPERNSKDSDENELNGQYVCASENMTSSRKLLVSREAEKLFEYSNAEMVSFMNEGAKAANVDYPLMSRIILDDDWVRVSQLFVDTILSSRSSDAGVTTSPRTESIRCVSKSGKVTQVLVSVRLSVRVNSQSNSDADSSSNSNSIDAKVSNSKLIHSSSWFFVPVSTDPAP